MNLKIFYGTLSMQFVHYYLYAVTEIYLLLFLFIP